jgi:L-lactate dehydrogenase complex protein LldE
VRVSLFVTCLNDTLFPATGIAVVRLLERLGHTVEFPEGQTCCGQMHLNSGYRKEARALARRFARVFADAEVVVAPSASCAAAVNELYPALGVEAPRVWELSQLLERLGVADVGSGFRGRVAYHPTCHSLRLLRVGEAPLRLLRAVPGVELVELAGAEECCGFGGTFAVKNADTSAAILADKLAAVEASGAEVVTALDNSCLMQIGGGLSRAGSAVRPLHLAELLAG